MSEAVAVEKRRHERGLLRPAPWLAGAVLLAACFAAAPAPGQLSPGPLAAPHAALEGSAHCLECHQAREGVSPERCLSCHKLLRGRIEAGRGLHARPEYASCQKCHVDHHGREFELVWWGDAGMEAFDHRQAGWLLEGAHRRLGCRECHRPELLADIEALRAQGKNLRRTFLGLERETCLSCHADEHRGQFAADRCASCHSLEAWTPVSAFDHDSTDFPLTGRHRQVDCTGCHRKEGEGEASFVRFAGLPLQRCTDCHRDPHDGRFGATCQRCHSTRGWEEIDRSQIDHERTRFPLRGRHRPLACESCHRGGTFRVARFQRCSDCHRDAHRGQFAPGASSRPTTDGSCESCHTVERFVPSGFALADHQESAYPLEGSHLAVPCDACHRMVTAAELPLAGSRGGEAVRQFRFASTACRDCHGDPHRGETERFREPPDCLTCHTLDGWQTVAFEHDRTDFPLLGRHAGLGCRECHRQVDLGTPDERLAMKGLLTGCAGCHRDPHQGQFDPAAGAAAAGDLCTRCHAVEGWKPVRFDHDRDSAFELVGAHRGVACGECHRAEQGAEGPFVRYRPLPTTCEGCHGGQGGERGQRRG